MNEYVSNKYNAICLILTGIINVTPEMVCDENIKMYMLYFGMKFLLSKKH